MLEPLANFYDLQCQLGDGLMKNAEHQQSPSTPTHSAADMMPRPSGNARVGKWTLIVLFGIVFFLEAFDFVTFQIERPSQNSMPWVRYILSFVLAIAVYQGARWARYVWLTILTLVFFAALFFLSAIAGVGRLDAFSNPMIAI